LPERGRAFLFGDVAKNGKNAGKKGFLFVVPPQCLKAAREEKRGKKKGGLFFLATKKTIAGCKLCDRACPGGIVTHWPEKD